MHRLAWLTGGDMNRHNCTIMYLHIFDIRLCLWEIPLIAYKSFNILRENQVIIPLVELQNLMGIVLAVFSPFINIVLPETQPTPLMMSHHRPHAVTFREILKSSSRNCQLDLRYF